MQSPEYCVHCLSSSPLSLKGKSRMLWFFGEIDIFRWLLIYDGWFGL